MKNLHALLAALLLAVVSYIVSCSPINYDQRLDLIEDRLDALENLCLQLNGDIESLKTIVSVLQDADFITGIEEISENGVVTGYIIHFNNHESITIRHGKDGPRRTKTGRTGKMVKMDRTDRTAHPRR